MRLWLGLVAIAAAAGLPRASAALEPVRVRILPLDLASEPARYLLRVECGDFSLSRIDAGLILPPSTLSGQLDFGGCAQPQTGFWSCANNPPRLGGTVSGAQTFALGPGSGAPGRSDTLYTSVRGSPLLCAPGQPADLAEIRVFNLVPDPAPMLVATTQRIDEVFGQAQALDGNGQAIPLDRLRYDTGAADSPTQVIVRRLPDGDGPAAPNRFEVVLESDIALSRVTLGLLIPQGLTPAQVRFGGCKVALPGNFDERGCTAGDPDLGFDVDAANSRTVGPSQALSSLGARGDTLYLVLAGAREIGSPERVLVRPGIRSRLGVIEIDAPLEPGFEDRLPPYTTFGLPVAPLLPGWLGDLGTIVAIADGGAAEPSSPPDYDRDSRADDHDLCPWYWEAAPSADTDADLRGDECECSDQNRDGRHSVSDLVAINVAIFTPALATPLCDANNDGLCNVLDIVGARDELFSPGHSATCSRFPSGRLP